MTNRADGWLTIREASLALGVSELTIRRRIKDGRMAHRLENGRYYVNPSLQPPPVASRSSRQDRGGKVLVETMGRDLPSALDGRDPGEGDDHRPDQPIRHDQSTNHESDQSGPPPPASLDLDALFAEQARLAETAGRALLLEEQLRRTEERQQTLQETVLTLAARNGWLESKLEEREQQVKLLTDGQRKRPWWKRLFATAGADS